MESRVQCARRAISIGSASTHSSGSNRSWPWTTRSYQNPLPGCVSSAGTWGLMLCNSFREILNNLIFECVLYNSSLMEQGGLSQGLGVWVWWGISDFRHLHVSQDLSSGASSPLPFWCHPPFCWVCGEGEDWA